MYLGARYLVQYPIQKIRELIKATTEFDFKYLRIDDKLFRQSDEIGEMARDIMVMREGLCAKAKTTQVVVEELLGIVSKTQIEIQSSRENTQDTLKGTNQLKEAIGKQVGDMQIGQGLLGELTLKIESLNNQIKEVRSATIHTEEETELASYKVAKLKDNFENHASVSENQEVLTQTLTTTNEAQIQSIEELAKTGADLTGVTERLKDTLEEYRL